VITLVPSTTSSVVAAKISALANALICSKGGAQAEERRDMQGKGLLGAAAAYRRGSQPPEQAAPWPWRGPLWGLPPHGPCPAPGPRPPFCTGAE
jgi:hypothetical protein